MAVVEEETAAPWKRKRLDKLEIRGGKKRSRERSWSDLPHDILLCILRLVVLSGSPGSSYAAVCRAWRASGKALASAAAPLLLRPAWGEAAMCPVGPAAARRRWRPGRTRPCLRAESPGPGPAAPPRLLPPLPTRFLRTRTVCQSRGYLITIDRSTSRPVLTNPLTGQELRPFPPLREPAFPNTVDFEMTGAVVGDPASPAGGCRIVLYCDDGFLRTCVSGTAAAWDTVRWDMLRDDCPIQLAVVKGRVYGLLSGGDLLPFDFVLSFHYFTIRIQEKPNAFGHKHKIGPYLVEHDGKIFTVHCTVLPLPPPSSSSAYSMVKFRVCRLVRRRWVELESLDGMSLFVDAMGSAMLRACPGEWGGKENHVYASGWLWDGWKVFPYGDAIRCDDLPVDDSIEACWPTPRWILPCSCY